MIFIYLNRAGHPHNRQKVQNTQSETLTIHHTMSHKIKSHFLMAREKK